MPKCYQNVVRNTKNKALFSVFLPLSNDQFLKVDFFDSFNGPLSEAMRGPRRSPRRVQRERGARIVTRIKQEGAWRVYPRGDKLTGV
jgi:hypothetical protein